MERRIFSSTHLFIGRGNQGYRNGWNRSGNERLAVQGVDATGKPVLLKPSVPRAQLAALIASLPPCRIGMAKWLQGIYLLPVSGHSQRPTLAHSRALVNAHVARLESRDCQDCQGYWSA